MRSEYGSPAAWLSRSRSADGTGPRATDGNIVFGPSAFRDLVSGRRKGIAATLSRAALGALEIPYTAAVRWRNHRYDVGRTAVTRVEVPVVCVGNITLGGTGKTPTVAWLASWFSDRGIRVALVSRGYGTTSGAPNDEALELAHNLPHVPHVLDADRVRGARRAIAEHDCQLVILDDGFQHRRIHRDLDIVLIDATEPFGFEHVFPRGTLREPLAGWARANHFLLTRAELVDKERRSAIRARALHYAPHAGWVEASHAPRCLQSPAGEKLPLEKLRGQSIAAFCGIGNPAGFRRTLDALGYQVAAAREFPDHFAYGAAHFQELVQWIDKLDVAAVVCTVKDLVKIADRWPGRTPLLALSARLEILSGQQQLEEVLAPLVEQAGRIEFPGRARG